MSKRADLQALALAARVDWETVVAVGRCFGWLLSGSNGSKNRSQDDDMRMVKKHVVSCTNGFDVAQSI